MVLFRLKLVSISGLRALILIGCLSASYRLEADPLRTKILYIAPNDQFIVLDLGSNGGVYPGDSVCLFSDNDPDLPLYCGNIAAAQLNLSALYVTSQIMPKLKVGMSAKFEIQDLEERLRQQNGSGLDLLITKLGAMQFTDKQRSFGIGYLNTPRAPISGHSLFFQHPIKRTQGVNSTLWQDQGRLIKSTAGLFVTYVGAPGRYFNWVYDGYFRFFSDIIDEQDNIPGALDSYVATTTRQSAIGLGIGAAFKKLPIYFLNFAPAIFFNVERSLLEFSAKSYGAAGSSELARARSQVYSFLIKPELELTIDSKSLVYGVSYGFLVPVYSTKKTEANVTMPSPNDVVTYSDKTSTNLISNLDHKSVGVGQEIRLLIRWILPNTF